MYSMYLNIDVIMNPSVTYTKYTGIISSTSVSESSSIVPPTSISSSELISEFVNLRF